MHKLYNVINDNWEELSLPIVVQRSQDVLPTITRKIEWYKEFISTNVPDKKHSAEEISNRLLEAIELSLQGKTNNAMEKISKVLEDYKKLGDKIIIQPLEETFLMEPDGCRRLFKARTGDNYGYDAKEMFHIPFSLRELVGNQRYSVSGLPCLYIGTSVYVCWEELGRPEPQSFWVSRIEYTNSDLKVLNLSYTLQDIDMMVSSKHITFEDLDNFLRNYLLSWILQCVCSISVISKVGGYRIEYIIPQLIMSCIKQLDIDGVLYFSVKGDYTKKHSSMIMKNYAFPADDFKLSQASQSNNHNLSKRLMESFSISRPLNLGFVSTVYSDNAGLRNEASYLNSAKVRNTHPLNKALENRLMAKLNISHHHNVNYEATKFFELEQLLRTTFPESLLEHSMNIDVSHIQKLDK